LPQAKSEVEEDFFTIGVSRWNPHLYWAKRGFSHAAVTKKLQIKKSEVHRVSVKHPNFV
jgi:hypothetical protein